MGRVFRRAAPEPISAAREVPVERLPSVRAVLVVHGMGQQVRFQALDEIAQGLLREAGGETTNPVARTVKIGDETYQRLELFLPLPGGGEREVHVYEAYWAPITEGQVTLRDVTSFLLGAAFNGLRNLGGALRYSFGRAHTIWPSFSAVFALASALGVLLTLVAMNGVLLALAALEGLEPGFVSAPLEARLTESAPALLAILAAFSLATLALLLVLVGVEWAKKRTARVRLDEIWRLLGTIASGSLFRVALLDAFGGARRAGARFRHRSRVVVARHVLVRVAGEALDASARRSPSGLGCHQAALRAIPGRRRRLRHVLQARPLRRGEEQDQGNRPEGGCGSLQATRGPKTATCGRMTASPVVAHSLGSVVAYDALNALLLDDTVSSEKRDVSARTRLFLTFGSPLEKTAFLFASPAKRTTDTREALVAAVQPLISDYAFRPFRWVNVFSRRDPISGRPRP